MRELLNELDVFSPRFDAEYFVEAVKEDDRCAAGVAELIR